jgi:nucleoside-diphosphate-sugar epimerase
VTGASGKLGRLLHAAWAAQPVPGLALHWASRERGAEIQWDILADRPPALPERATILHLAGVTAGDEAALRQNSAMIAPLVAAADANRAQAILFVSTAAVYGRLDRPAGEEDQPQPLAPYGVAKLAAERALLAQHTLRATILRLGNVVGADALLGAQNLNREISLDPVAGRPGGPIRSWIGPQLLAQVLGQLVRAPLPHVLNIAAGPPLPMADLLEAAGRRWRYGPPRLGVLDYAVLDTARLQSLCPVGDVSASMLAQEAAWASRVLQ